MRLLEEDFLYHQVADRLESMIENGVLKSGDKLLSVRTLCREQGVSHSTAFKAYAALESKGLVEARAKSGYYVRFLPKSAAPRFAADPEPNRQWSVEEMISEVYEKMSESGVMQFSLAAPDISLLPSAKLNKCLLEALRRSPSSCLLYADASGSENLRRQVARLSFKWGGKPGSDEVVITNGCMEALSICLQAVTRPGDTVAIESPTYFGIFNLLKSLHLHALEIPVDPETGIDLDYLKTAVQNGRIAACLFIPNFNNPVGSVMPDAAKKELVGLLADAGIPLVEDDIYGEMYFGKTRPRSCKSFDRQGMVLYCSSFSKALAPGYRVGWCLPGKFLSRVRQLKLTHSLSTATPTQEALSLFCETGRFDLHLRHLRKALHTQCLRYSQAIATFFPEGTRLSRPQGGYVLWIELPRKVNALDVYRRARRQQIAIAPGQLFSLSDQFAHCIRIGFGAPYTSAIEMGLKRLGNLVM
ncbi:MAG: PLP-dependent aminotransferase family protein [Lewinellaceae bacterium]|nr:PLP-dependent aminotransferase family protein [Lewinellaceae bacterium]